MNKYTDITLIRADQTSRKGRVVIFDIDNTVTKTEPDFHAFECEHDRQTAERLGLPFESFLDVRKGDVTTRSQPFDIAVTIPFVAAMAGMSWDSDFCLAQTRQFLEGIIERERQLQPFPGALTALPTIRERFPDCSIMVATDCPLWLAILRLQTQGLLPYIDSAVGINFCIPDILRQERYAASVQFAEEWAQNMMCSSATHHMHAIVGVPPCEAKPSAVGPLAVIHRGMIDPQGTVVMVDDKPLKGGGLVRNLRAACMDAHFVHAKIGWHTAVGPSDLEPEAEMLSSVEDLIPILDGFFSQEDVEKAA